MNKSTHAATMQDRISSTPSPIDIEQSSVCSCRLCYFCYGIYLFSTGLRCLPHVPIFPTHVHFPHPHGPFLSETESLAISIKGRIYSKTAKIAENRHFGEN